ncbi:MAG: DNA repair protein RecN [Spirochaetales bacterium]|jgi:DNA repair protein RecN (Recombination protein N)|nr:DNA repair protein RecN [Spirochaetales bacterium]
MVGGFGVLEQLNIKNYALIDELEVNFAPGFNVLTGETGAGKSILIGAVGLLMGQKGEGGLIRRGCEQLEVSGCLKITPAPALTGWLAAREIPFEEDRLILRRVIKTGGRSGCFVQGAAVPRADLQELAGLLIDIHGQNEHQSLLSPDTQRRLLDRFGGTEEMALSLGQDFSALGALKKEFERMTGAEEERRREIELLRHAAREIEEAGLKAGEEEELQRERTLLAQGEKLFTHLSAFLGLVAGEEGLVNRLKSLRDELSRIAGIDSTQESPAARMESAYYEIEDIVEAVKDYRRDLDFSPRRLEDCEARLAEIRRLSKKYAEGVEGLLAYREEALEKAAGLESWDSRQEEWRLKILQLEKRIQEKAAGLSAKRRAAAARLGGEIKSRLTRLGMERGDFKIETEPRLSREGKAVCGPQGYDQIEFLISPNLGEALKPLKSIASGGEVSRIMLAIKSVLSETDEIGTLIFDEVDAGIGGEVALTVGEYLGEIAKSKQVLCITHLASIAVRADNQIKVEKSVKNGRTLTDIFAVSGEARTQEIARMLSGDPNDKTSLAHARELLGRRGTERRNLGQG